MDELADEPALQWRPDLPEADTAVVWRRRRETGPARRWTAVAAAAVLSGPFAIAGAMVENSTSGAAVVLLLAALGAIPGSG